MNRAVRAGSAVLALWLTLLCLASVHAADKPVRTLKIVVAADAAPKVRQAAAQVLSAVDAHPLLRALGERSPPTKSIDSQKLFDSQQLLAAPIAERAYSHLVLVGLPEDPLIAAAWQREARRTEQGWYAFGFGWFQGTIGYVESDRNPFLHSSAIDTAPFETEIITLSGNSPAGVALAVDAFLKQGLVNGIVAAPGWTRPAKSLLDREPLPPDFSLPDWLPTTAADMVRVGVTAAAEDEYREVLADTGVAPRQMWRLKFHRPGVWDQVGEKSANEAYSCGLHRRAYGNSLWAAQFASAEAAREAARKIAAVARLTASGNAWRGDQPPYGVSKEPSGPLALWQRDEWLLMCTLPSETTRQLVPK